MSLLKTISHSIFYFGCVKAQCLFLVELIEVEGRETPVGERVAGDPTGTVFAEEAPGLAHGKRVSWNENQQQVLTEPLF
ncbi:hypothetical protein [Bacillus pinisoli]|uniref:hypothetical protein n=1 Tax=Bacillus pinisoli TaxID=2901866 RepID=UPI001FF4F4B1|nr:hypothetical protein [Bacillus pinisoli]